LNSEQLLPFFPGRTTFLAGPFNTTGCHSAAKERQTAFAQVLEFFAGHLDPQAVVEFGESDPTQFLFHDYLPIKGSI
jgi:hypothetical protein